MTSPARTVNYSGYRVLDQPTLLDTLAQIGVLPVYDRIIAEHVTYRYPDRTAAPTCDLITVVGHACDDGVQALLVAVDGTTIAPDGRRFHLTLSLAPGRSPAQSNDLLARITATPIRSFTVPVSAF